MLELGSSCVKGVVITAIGLTGERALQANITFLLFTLNSKHLLAVML